MDTPTEIRALEDLKNELSGQLDRLVDSMGAHTEQTERIADYLGEAVTEATVSRLCDAIEYQGYLEFNRLMLDSLGTIVQRGPEDKLRKATEALLAKLMAPPFERRVKAAYAASRIRVTEAVADALKAEESGHLEGGDGDGE